MLTIYDPVSGFFAGLLARGHRYRCIVDGRDEFRGERLPVGTEEEIVAWIKARYKILGELWLFNNTENTCSSYNIIYERGISPLWFAAGTWNPPHVTKRYLVEVEGEKVFVLQPNPDGFLEWSVKGALGWNGQR